MITSMTKMMYQCSGSRWTQCKGKLDFTIAAVVYAVSRPHTRTPATPLTDALSAVINVTDTMTVAFGELAVGELRLTALAVIENVSE